MFEICCCSWLQQIVKWLALQGMCKVNVVMSYTIPCHAWPGASCSITGNIRRAVVRQRQKVKKLPLSWHAPNIPGKNIYMCMYSTVELVNMAFNLYQSSTNNFNIPILYIALKKLHELCYCRNFNRDSLNTNVLTLLLIHISNLIQQLKCYKNEHSFKICHWA